MSTAEGRRRAPWGGREQFAGQRLPGTPGLRWRIEASPDEQFEGWPQVEVVDRVQIRQGIYLNGQVVPWVVPRDEPIRVRNADRSLAVLYLPLVLDHCGEFDVADDMVVREGWPE